MKLDQLQKKSTKIVDQIDEKYQVDRDGQLTVAQLVEELGELVTLVNCQRLRKKDPAEEEVKEEFADVFLQFAKLAEYFQVNIEQAVLEKIKVLEDRHQLKKE